MSGWGSWVSSAVESVASAGMKLEEAVNKTGLLMKLDENDADTGSQTRKVEDKDVHFLDPVCGDAQTGKNCDAAEENPLSVRSSSGSAVAPETWHMPPWDSPPDNFWASHCRVWRTLILNLLCDENTFVIAPQRLLEQVKDVEAKLLHFLVAGSALPVILPADADAPTDFISHCSTRIQAMHFRLAPVVVQDHHFWKNVHWRIRLLQLTESVENALQVIRIVNTEPTPKPETTPVAVSDAAEVKEVKRKRNIGVWDNGPLLDRQAESVRAALETDVRFKQLFDRVRAEISGSNGSRQLLQNVLCSPHTESMELAESIADSCKFHKTKLAKHLAALNNVDEDVFQIVTSTQNGEEKDADGDDSGGGRSAEINELRDSLMACNENMEEVLRDFEKWRTVGLLPTSEKRSERHVDGSGVVKSSSDGTADSYDHIPDDPNVFTADVPWDDDADEEA